jgi:hypothetical protein
MQRLTNHGATAKFADSGQSGQYNHGHASQMGHSAARRLQIARALGGKPSAPTPDAAGGGHGDEPKQDAPPANFKAHIAGQAAIHGHMIGADHIHSAIDTLAANGHITPFQAGALKNHNGSLHGPNGAATQTAIMQALLHARKA